MKLNHKILLLAPGLIAAAAFAAEADATKPAQTQSATAVDNTERNTRDRDPASKTPLDQGGNKTDTETTAHIRRGIIAEKGMSVNARNIKIITANGMVTLRGPVDTAEEKQRIGEIARNAAPQASVDNQLEVK